MGNDGFRRDRLTVSVAEVLITCLEQPRGTRCDKLLFHDRDDEHVPPESHADGAQEITNRPARDLWPPPSDRCGTTTSQKPFRRREGANAVRTATQHRRSPWPPAARGPTQ